MTEEKEAPVVKKSRKKLKIAIAVVVVVILALFIALLNLGKIVTANQDYLIAQAEQLLGRDISVDAVEVAFWPSIGVRLNQIAISDDKKFSDEDLLRADDLRLNLKIMPLLSGNIEVKSLIIHNPDIRLIRDKNGNMNILTLGPAPLPKQPGFAKPDPAKEEPTKTESGEMPLEIGVMEITGGAIHYLDKKDNVDIKITQADLAIRDFSKNNPFSLSFEAALPNAKSQNIQLTGTFGPIVKDMNNLQMKGDLQLDSFELGTLNQFDFIKTAIPPDLSFGGPISLKAQFNGTPAQLSIKGNLNADKSNIKYGDLFTKSDSVSFTLSTDSAISKDKFAFNDIQLTLHTLELAASGEMTRAEIPNIQLKADSDAIGLSGWDDLVPMLKDYALSGKIALHSQIQTKLKKGSKPKIQGNLNLSDVGASIPQLPLPIKDLNAKANFEGDRAKIEDVSLRLGKTQINCSADIESLSPLSLKYNLNIPTLNLADVQPQKEGGSITGILNNLISNGQFGLKDKAISYTGKTTSQQGKVSEIEYNDLQIACSLIQDNLEIQNLALQILGGSINAKGSLDLGKDSQKFDVSSKVENVDLAALSKSFLSNIPKLIQGKANLDMDMRGVGREWDAIKTTLAGKGHAEVLDGELLDVNIADDVLSGITGIPGISSLVSPNIREKYPEIFNTQNTKFDQLTTAMTADKGVITISDLQMRTQDWSMIGAGVVNPDQKMNLKAKLFLSSRLSTEMTADVKEAKYLINNDGQIEIPFKVSGTLPNVKPKPDLDMIGDLLKRSLIQKGLDKVKVPGLKKSAEGALMCSLIQMTVQ